MTLKKPQPQPTRPLRAPADAVKPVDQADWGLERFAQTEARLQAQLDAQLLEQMRAELKPRLDKELAQLKGKAREEGYRAGFEAGRKAGYEKGYAQGRAAAAEEAAVQQASWQRETEALLTALNQPLSDLDERLADTLAEVVTRSVATFLQSDPQLEQTWLRTTLQKVVHTLQQQRAGVEIYVPAGAQTRIAELLGPLADHCTLYEDPELPSDHYRVTQDASEVTLNLATALDGYLEALRSQLAHHVKDTVAHTAD
ncbi:Flagellar biosynthesis/type III secretory pathway protein FliH [Sulfurivirga caldicuralii]|uniref:Flagellar biosynthesis/type III secretory pathway protein FliH n=1 Tax=Sulfurivirga caldicuralii TaxID=364032 RepID=A0A1N6FM29_9GAMM|nr:FliH/SctL family protein [Sulfurivirga caldicuralii]SIN96315.1 Flagellar biosynthesis/type III secretory pathway protein FliH [Sulfurivirga caldicuralii]